MTRRRTAAIALALLGTLAGCGSDDSADPADPVTVTTTATSEPTPSESTSAPPETEPTEPVEPSETETSNPAVDLSQPPRTYDEAEAHFAAAFAVNDVPQELSRFESADGSYYCVLDDEFIAPSCEVLEGVKDPGACAGSPSQKVGRIELTNAGWRAYCNTDTIRMAGAPVLAVGGVASWTGLSVQCLMETIGVTCLETGNRQGFFFGPGHYQVF